MLHQKMKNIYLLIAAIGVLCPCCKPVDITDQAGLSRPIFDFNAKGTRSIECGITSQLENGRASASNVTAGGCSSCR